MTESHAWRTSVKDWVEKHACIMELVPWPGNKRSVIADCRQLRSFLDEVPSTQSTFKSTHVWDDPVSGMHTSRFRTLLTLCGSWAYWDTSRNGVSRWTVPHYQHHDEWDATPDEPVETHAERCARVGLISLSDIGTRYNLSKQQVSRRVDGDWGEMRTEGRERLWRSLQLWVDWHGLQRNELAALIGVSRHSVTDNFKKFGFSVVPEMPENTHHNGWIDG